MPENNEIIENDYGLNENDIRNVIKSLEKDEFAAIQELLCSNKINYSKLAIEIQKIKPKDQYEYIQILKITCVYFLSAKGMFEIRQKNDSLCHILSFKTEGSNFPAVAKSLIQVLETNRNILYFSRKLSQINENGRLLGCLLVWVLTFKLVGEEMEEVEFKDFSSLIKILDNVDIDLLPDNVNILHLLLECIGFLLNAILIRPVKSPEYLKYFEYSIQDVTSLKEWIFKIYEKFPVSHNQENVVDVNARICEIIDFILKEYINTVLKDNSFMMLSSQDMSFSDTILSK